jgi:DNA-binding ferritin-like protein
MERTLKSGSEATSKVDKVDSMTAECVEEILNSAVSFHKLHLQVEGDGSFSAHMALKELYEAMPELGDTIAEGFQGASEKLLKYKHQGPVILKSVDDAIQHIRNMYDMITELQKIMPYSEIINSLDTVKDALNSGKYKLIFLK